MIGHHIVWDAYDCDADAISFVADIKKTLNAIVDSLDITKVAEQYKQFDPVGATGFILLAESHVSIHTWPENSFAAIDVFSCNTINTAEVNEVITKMTKCKSLVVKDIARGEMVNAFDLAN